MIENHVNVMGQISEARRAVDRSRFDKDQKRMRFLKPASRMSPAEMRASDGGSGMFAVFVTLGSVKLSVLASQSKLLAAERTCA
jgi:hypothetical protein